MSNEGYRSPGLDGVVMLVMVVVIVLAFWHFSDVYIMSFLFKVSPYIFSMYEYAPDLLISPELKYRASMLAHKLPSIDPYKNSSFDHLVTILALLGVGFRILILPFFAYLTYFYFHPKSSAKYRRIFTLEKLVNQNAAIFPAVNLFVPFNLHKGNQHEGPLAVAQTSIDFAIRNGLLLKQGKPITKSIPSKIYGPLIPRKRKFLGHFSTISLDKDKCDELMEKQLGARWNGPEELPDLVRALYAVFCARAVGGDYTVKGNKLLEKIARTIKFGEFKKESNSLLVKIVRILTLGIVKIQLKEKSWSTPHSADISGADEIIEETRNHERIRDISNSHAYQSTVLFALLLKARRTGKLAPALFKWLRYVDRTLWYSLHMVGGRKPWVEGIAAWTHYHCEIDMQSSIPKPCIEGATDSLEHDLHNEQWLYVDKWGIRDKEQDAAREAAADLLSTATDADRQRAAQGLDTVTPKEAK